MFKYFPTMASIVLTILSQTSNKATFDDNDALFVLEKVHDALLFGEVIGRADISRATGIGEGTVRTIVQRLRSMGLLEVSRDGIGMTKTGIDFLSAVGITLIRIDHTDSAIGAYQVPLLIKGKAGLIEKGIEQRNCAIKVGADGCTTIVCKGGALVLPPDWNIDEKSPALASQIRRYDVEEGDVVLIGGSDTGPRMASAASNSAALALLAP